MNLLNTKVTMPTSAAQQAFIIELPTRRSEMRVIPMKYLCINMSTNNTEIFKLITFLLLKDMLGKAAFQRKRLFSITAEDWIIFSAWCFSRDLKEDFKEWWKPFYHGCLWRVFVRAREAVVINLRDTKLCFLWTRNLALKSAVFEKVLGKLFVDWDGIKFAENPRCEWTVNPERADKHWRVALEMRGIKYQQTFSI